MKKPKPKKKKYTIIRDQQEKANYWTFPPSEICAGTEVSHLKTGDYIIKELPDIVVIERKGRISEWSQNVWQPRFERELERLAKFPRAYILCEFSMDDIYNFPYSSDIPKYKWKKLKITANFIAKRTLEFSISYPTVNILLANKYGQRVAGGIFKEVITQYG